LVVLVFRGKLRADFIPAELTLAVEGIEVNYAGVFKRLDIRHMTFAFSHVPLA